MANGDNKAIGTPPSATGYLETTTTATGQAICDYTPPDDCTIAVWCFWTAQHDTTPATISGGIVTGLFSKSAGTVTERDAAQPSNLQLGTARTIALAASSGRIELQCTGVVDVHWSGAMIISQVEAT